MNTKTNQYVQNQQTSQKCKVVPCDIPPFCRNNYFTGKLLTERDLTAEQRYLTDKLRLHHLSLHGWGVICGLRVRSHPYCPELKVIVEPGLAIDPCGRFIRVLKEVEVDLPKPTPLPDGGKDPCAEPPTGSGYKSDRYSTRSSGEGSYNEQPTNTGGYDQGSNYGSRESYSGPAQQQGQYQPSGPYQQSSQPVNYQQPGQYQQAGQNQSGEYQQPSQYQQPGQYQQAGQYQSGEYPQPGHQQSGQYQQASQYQSGEYQQPSQYQQPGQYQQPRQYQQSDPYQQSGPYREAAYSRYSGETQPTVTLYFCLSYAECDDELMPAPFDECACSNNGQKPNRICETYTLSVETEKPEGFDEVQDLYDCDEDDCLKLFDVLVNPCKRPIDLKCLPLAIVNDQVLGEAVTEDRIDYSVRPILHSTQYLEAIVRCLAEKIPTKTLTKIVDIGWTHHGEYHFHDFVRQFISDSNSPKGFEVTFGSPVRREGINRRTFQAIAVRYTDPSGAGEMEMVPTRIRMSDDRLRAYLEIDPRYVQRRLERIRFDLYLKLRCGQILDDNGLAVDGDLLAQLDDNGNYVVATPTGDGVAGGVFESWIRVTNEMRQ